MGGGHLQESNHRGPIPRRVPGTYSLWKIINCMECLSCDMCKFHFVAKVLRISQEAQCPCSEHRGQRMCQVVTYKRLKTMENH